MYARSPSTGHSIPSKMQPHRACQRRSAKTPNQQKNTTSPDRHNPVGDVRFAHLRESRETQDFRCERRVLFAIEKTYEFQLCPFRQNENM